MVENSSANPAEGFSDSTFLSPLTLGESGESGLRQKNHTDDETQQQESKTMKKRYTETQIVSKLRQADVLIGKGQSVPEVCREIEVSQQTYYRWRQKYGGMSPEMVKELKALQKENVRLKKIVADQVIDMAILKEAAKNF